MPANRALEPDGDIAQADRLVPGLEQRPGDDADGVGEVDDPRVRAARFCTRVGDVEDHGDRPQRLRQTAGAGGLLPDAAALERARSRRRAARGLSADAQLDEHGVGAGDAGVEVGVVVSSPGWPWRWSIRRPSPPMSASRSSVGVDQDQLVDRERVRSLPMPSISSGVYVDPPPTTAIFILSPP